jgi:hypothetical protein
MRALVLWSHTLLVLLAIPFTGLLALWALMVVSARS